MAKPINISLDRNIYSPPTSEDIRKAKEFVLFRSETARMAQETAGDIIEDAAEKLVLIAYKYNIPAYRFTFDTSTNKRMMDEVNEVMDDMEDEIYSLIIHKGTAITADKDRKAALIALLVTLGHRNMTLRETIHAYSWRVLRQVEALVVSARNAGISRTEAAKLARTGLTSFAATKAFTDTQKERNKFAAPFIRNGGKTTFPDGSPNIQGVPKDGKEAIKNVVGTAVNMAWTRNQALDMVEDRRCIGYWQDRGSNLPCALCDSEVGFHDIYDGTDITSIDYPHINCMCWRVPIYSNGEQGNIEYS